MAVWDAAGTLAALGGRRLSVVGLLRVLRFRPGTGCLLRLHLAAGRGGPVEAGALAWLGQEEARRLWRGYM